MRIPSGASREFWRAHRRLPRDVRKAATRAYRIWMQDASHPSLHFKKVGSEVWSGRIGIHHRAIGTFHGDRIVWIWIGTPSTSGRHRWRLERFATTREGLASRGGTERTWVMRPASPRVTESRSSAT